MNPKLLIAIVTAIASIVTAVVSNDKDDDE